MVKVINNELMFSKKNVAVISTIAFAIGMIIGLVLGVLKGGHLFG